MIESRQATSPFPRPTLVMPSRIAESRLWASRYLTSEERSALERAMLPARTIPAGLDLVPEGARADNLFIIVDGWAGRYATTRRGGRQFVGLALPGDLGNLDSLMFDRPDYGLRTLTDVTAVALPREQALALAEAHPGIARTFTWLALVENAILGKWALTLGRQPARERLCHMLCELGVRLDAESGNTSRYAFPLTQEHLADTLGLTAVHINRTMQQLRADRLVEVGNRLVKLSDVARLRKIAGFDPTYLHIEPPVRARFA